MNCQIGDVVQIDGGLVIVTSIKGDRANILPVTEFKGRRPHALDNGINVDISRDRLFEKRGEAGLAAFMAEHAEAKNGKRKGKIKTELGDMLCYQGRICTVFKVSQEGCKIGDLEGNDWNDDRWLNEFFFQDCACHRLVRLDEKERAENLSHFRVNRKLPLKLIESNSANQEPKTENMNTENTNIEKVEAKNSRGGRRERRAASKKVEPKTQAAAPVEDAPSEVVAEAAAPSGKFTGRAALTRSLAFNTSRTVEDIHAEVKLKFSGASMSTTRKIVKSERGF